MKTTTILLCLAMTLLGAVTGGLVGLSTSPVAATVLPLLFGLLGGTGGYFVLKTDVSARGPQQGLVVYSLTVICFTSGFAGGTWWGVGERTSTTPWSLVGDEGRFTIPPGGATPSESAAWLALDARLHALGLTAAQRAHFASRVHAQVGHPALDAETLDAMRTDLAAAMPPTGIVAHRKEWQDVRALVDRADVDTADRLLVALTADVHLLRDDDDDRAYLDATPEARAALERFEQALSDAAAASRLRGSLAAVSAEVGALLDAAGEAIAAMPNRTIASTGSPWTADS